MGQKQKTRWLRSKLRFEHEEQMRSMGLTPVGTPLYPKPGVVADLSRLTPQQLQTIEVCKMDVAREAELSERNRPRWIRRRQIMAAKRERRRTHKERRLRRQRKPVPDSPSFSPQYVAYIHSRPWFRLRKRVFEQRGRQCERCGTAKGIIQVHHKTYKRLGRELLEDLEVLCKRCHEKHHGRRFAEQNTDATQSGTIASNWLKTVEKDEIC